MAEETQLKAGLIAIQKVLAVEKKAKKERNICRPTLAQCNDNKNKKKGPKAISWKDGRVKKKNGGFIAKGCGKVMNNRRKVTTMS